MDAEFDIALNLPYSEIVSSCNNRFHKLCTDDDFWYYKLKRDFLPKLGDDIPHRILYESKYNEGLGKFKDRMGMRSTNGVNLRREIEHNNEVSLYRDKLSYPYTYDGTDPYFKFQLKEDLFIISSSLYDEDLRERLYPRSNLIVVNLNYLDTFNINIDDFIKSGKAFGITNREFQTLNLFAYKYFIPGTYIQPSIDEIEDWAQAGFIYRSV